MPSLHFAWSLWCCLALWPRLRSVWTRVLAVAHPTITLVAIVATANHYWLDAAGGALALLLGWLLGGVLGARAVDRVASWPPLSTRRVRRSAISDDRRQLARSQPDQLAGPAGGADPPPRATGDEPAPARAD